MTIRHGALYDSLLHPGDVPLAEKAAEEAASVLTELAAIRLDISRLQTDMHRTIWSALIAMTAIFAAISTALRFIQ